MVRISPANTWRPSHSLLSYPHPPGHMQGVLSNHKETADIDEMWYES